MIIKHELEMMIAVAKIDNALYQNTGFISAHDGEVHVTNEYLMDLLPVLSEVKAIKADMSLWEVGGIYNGTRFFSMMDSIEGLGLEVEECGK